MFDDRAQFGKMEMSARAGRRVEYAETKIWFEILSVVRQVQRPPEPAFQQHQRTTFSF